MIHTNVIKMFYKKSILIYAVLTCILLSPLAHAIKQVSTNDPWESANRRIFIFNEKLDEYVLKPTAKIYKSVLPQTIRNMISNFFSNLGEITNFINALLQFRVGEALDSLGRFTVNSTIGVLGFADIAKKINIHHHSNDFGTTLAHWNIASGPYVVLPFFGPKTLRSVIGFAPDFYIESKLSPIKKEYQQYLKGLNIVNIRSNLLLNEQLLLGDKYTFIRDAYLQYRNYQITGEPIEDDF